MAPDSGTASFHLKNCDSNQRIGWSFKTSHSTRHPLKILEPFADATDILQGERVVTASHVIPAVNGLRSSLTATAKPGVVTSKSAQRFKTALLESLNRRFAVMESNPFFMTATVLDPRFKLLPWNDSHSQAVESEVRPTTCVMQIDTPKGVSYSRVDDVSVCVFLTSIV